MTIASEEGKGTTASVVLPVRALRNRENAAEVDVARAERRTRLDNVVRKAVERPASFRERVEASERGAHVAEEGSTAGDASALRRW